MAFFETYSYKSGAALSIGFTFIWKALSFINSILIAFYFGTQTNSDIYFYILYIAGLIGIFFTSLNSNVVIPQAIYLKRTGEQKAQSFLNFFLLFYGTILLLMLFLGFLFPVDIFALFSKFSIEVLTKETLLLQLAFLYFAGYILCYFILDIMYIHRLFSLNFLFPLNALIPMLIMLLFHNILGLKTMLIGFIISYLIQISLGLFLMKSKLNWSFKSFKITFEKRLRHNLITNQILIIANFITSMLPVYLISNFAGGIISALSYAKQLTDAPSEILTSKITGVYHIQLNENASSKDYKALNTNYIKVNYLILFVLVPLALFTCFFAPDIIDLFFKRGKFNTQSALNVVKFLRPLMILLLVNALMPLTTNLIACTRKIKESFVYLLTQYIITFLALYFFITHFGAFAYPYVQIGCGIFSYFVMALFFKKHIPEIYFWQPLKDALLLVFLNLLALIPAGFAGRILEGQNCFIRILLCGLIFLFTLTLLYLPARQIKKLLPFLLGAHYKTFLNKVPQILKQFF